MPWDRCARICTRSGRRAWLPAVPAGFLIVSALGACAQQAIQPSPDVQPPPAAAATAPVPAAAAEDVESIDAIIAALYDVISGPAGEKRDWDRFRSLFIADARLIPTGRAPDGTGRHRVLTPNEYARGSGPILERDGFFEREIGRSVDRFGSIVQVFSAYDSRRTLADAEPFARGINSIQLWNDGKRWYVVTIFWQGESPSTPIPAEYLGQP